MTLTERPNALYQKDAKSRRGAWYRYRQETSTDSEEVDSDSGYSSPLHRRNQMSNGTHPVVGLPPPPQHYMDANSLLPNHNPTTTFQDGYHVTNHGAPAASQGYMYNNTPNGGLTESFSGHPYVTGYPSPIGVHLGGGMASGSNYNNVPPGASANGHNASGPSKAAASSNPHPS